MHSRHACVYLLVLAVILGRGIAQPPAEAPVAPPEDPEAALAAEIDGLLGELHLQPEESAVLRTEFLEGDDATGALLALLLLPGDDQSMVPQLLRSLQPEVVPLSESQVLVVEGRTARVLSLVTGELGKPIPLGRPDAADRLLMLKVVRAACAAVEERDRRATLTAHLAALRNAVDLYNNDMGTFPEALYELTRTDNRDPNYHGPYIRAVPRHPYGGVYGADPRTGVVWERH